MGPSGRVRVYDGGSLRQFQKCFERRWKFLPIELMSTQSDVPIYVGPTP